MSILVVSAVLVTGSSEQITTVEPTNWAGGRVNGFEASLTSPWPTNLEELLDFAGVEGVIDPQDQCLAQAIYFEARGEPIEGQFAVGRVVMNRVQDRRYPGTICGVVYQNEKWVDRCQFSFACDGSSDDPAEQSAWLMARRIATLVKSAWLPDNSGAATHYHANYVHPNWAGKLTRTVSVGNHIFYREDIGE